MFGIVLAGVSSALGELSSSIGKYEIKKHAISYYSIGFLTLLCGEVLFLISGIVRHDFVFALAALPTFVPRIALEIIQAHVGVLALKRCDRSDFGFVKTLTVPLLLVVDHLLGYRTSTFQVLGMVVIVAAIMMLFSLRKNRTKGLILLLISSVNAVATITLYKYNITHFNSVEAEEGIVTAILMLYFFILAWVIARENPLRFLAKPIFVLQSVTSGLMSISSFAFLFAPAAVITTSLRASAVLFAMISGKVYFHEKDIYLKSVLFCALCAGLVLLALGS